MIFGWLWEKNEMAGRFPENRRSFLVSGKRGFALVAALMAIWILTAMGVLVFTVSTQDLRVSTRLLGEKRAFSAAETGLHWLTQNFDNTNPGGFVPYQQRVDPNNPPTDPQDVYSVGPGPGGWYPTKGPGMVWLAGYKNEWGRTRHLATVTGENTRHNSRVQVDAGIGYGPVKGGLEKQ